MKEHAIALLAGQLDKLKQQAQFDFKAWKQQTSLILARIFGKEDLKIQEINALDFEFNSWSLRDASGNISYKEGVKRSAAAIVEAAILELEHFGIPKIQNETNQELEKLQSIIKDEFTGHQIKSIRNILQSSHSFDEKKRQLMELIGVIDTKQLQHILCEILLNEYFSKDF